MGDFLETRASRSAGAACERSVSVPWELGLEQQIAQNVYPFGVSVVGASQRCICRGWHWPDPPSARGIDSPVPVAWPRAGAGLCEARLVENHQNWKIFVGLR